MLAVAHNKKFAKKVGIPQSTGKEFAPSSHKAYSKLPERKK